MIFVWLKAALYFVLRLIIPPPARQAIPEIDPNEVCPSCGHKNGSITSVMVGEKRLVRHDCKTCRAWWHVDPVLKSDRVQAEGANNGK